MPGPGRRQRLLLVGRDVSSKRAMEQFRAEQADIITHDMGTPLYTITGNIEYFVSMHGSQLSPEKLRPLTTSLASARSISDLLTDLDLVTRRDAGELIFERSPMDLMVEVRQAAQELTLTAQQKEVALSFQADQPLPLALADPKRALQVARNLIGNAIKYTPRGGRAHVRLFADAQYVTLQVADTGPGIPDEVKPNIWRRYYQMNKESPGSGLGLASVRIIADALNGHYRVDDNPAGIGSIFTVSFPRA
jgi:signal transduction histidine kinase